MKPLHTPIRFGLSVALCTFLGAVSCPAQLNFTVTTDTSSLVGGVGPFSLDFQFNDGSGTGDGNNVVTLSDFIFGGGNLIGAPTLTGGASTPGGGVIKLTDTDFFNEFLQDVNPGATLSFKVSMTTLADAGGTPDEFSFAILDAGSEIPTSGSANEFLSVTLDPSGPIVSTFNSVSGGINVGITPVPESAAPAVSALLAAGAWALVLLLHRRQNQCAA